MPTLFGKRNLNIKFVQSRTHPLKSTISEAAEVGSELGDTNHDQSDISRHEVSSVHSQTRSNQGIVSVTSENSETKVQVALKHMNRFLLNQRPQDGVKPRTWNCASP